MSSVEFFNRLRTEAASSSLRLIARVQTDLVLHEVSNASLQDARETSERDGDHKRAASMYQTIVSSETSPPYDRSAAVIELARQLQLLGRLGQAERTLQNFDQLAENLPEREQIYLRARKYEVLGWNFDMLLDFEQSASQFEQVLMLMGRIPDGLQGRDEEQLVSTARHCLGREAYFQALLGKDKETNLRKAEQAFESDLLDFYIPRRELGQPEPGGEFFTHAFLARAHMELNNPGKALEEVDLAERYHSEYVESAPGRLDVIAQIYILRGQYHSYTNETAIAQECFEQALKHAREYVQSPKTESHALSGLALTHWKQHNYLQAFECAAKGLKRYPAVITRPIT